MKLPIIRTEEQGEVTYFIPLKKGKLKRTISLENAQCAVNGKEVVFAEVYDVDARIDTELQSLSEEYESIVKLKNGFRIEISKNSEEKTTNCMVNIDVDESGEILSIEVI